MDIVTVLLSPFWLMLPALVPNSAAVLFGGRISMDFGRSWRGKRILGDGKTWRGFFGGAMTGVLLGLLGLLLSEPFSVDHFGFGDYMSAIPIIFALAFGSLLGDTFGAFVKRRLGLSRGAKAPGLDQYDFVLGAFLLSFVVSPDWFVDSFVAGDRWIGLLFFILVIPFIHRGVNIIGYKLGKKDVPW